MCLPNNSVGLIDTFNALVVFPTVGVGAVKIDYHTSFTVDTCGTCININGFVGFAVDGYQVGIISIGEVARNRDRPDTL